MFHQLTLPRWVSVSKPLLPQDFNSIRKSNPNFLRVYQNHLYPVNKKLCQEKPSKMFLFDPGFQNFLLMKLPA